MKRCWFGGGLLVLLLILSLLLSLRMEKAQRELHENMLRAAALADTHREEAQNIADQVWQRWQRRRGWMAVLSDHAPMEAIEEKFQLLTPQAETEDFRETCLRLAAQLKALGEAQMPTWENLF